MLWWLHFDLNKRIAWFLEINKHTILDFGSQKAWILTVVNSNSKS